MLAVVVPITRVSVGLPDAPDLSRAAEEPSPGGGVSVDKATDLSFRAIYDAHFRLVWHALRRWAVAEKDLLDQTQNVFLVAHRKLPEFEGRSQLRTWILQIARRVASDYRRSAAVRREVMSDSSETESEASHGLPADEALASGERAKIARAILNRLPSDQREVFIMFELEQLSGQEIADELGISLGTVRSRLRLARASFQREVRVLASGLRREGTNGR